MDRIDLHIEADGVTYNDLATDANAEPSAIIRARVEKARDIQRKRFAGAVDNDEPAPDRNSAVYCNAKMTQGDVKNFCKLDTNGERILRTAFERLNLSARAYSRILKVARTIADLASAPDIMPEHVTEAVSYRSIAGLK